MRNLKRALSLALASVMLLGMMVVGTGASYADVESTDNVEAIEVMQAVSIMVGDDNGNFNPDQEVTRNEMAVIMANMLDYKIANYAGTAPFTDVPAWAEPYVAACYTHGIIAGYSNTQFGGDDSVTAAQAALMMMKALGYFQYSSDFGQDWQLSTIRQANKIDLYNDINVATIAPMTRNDVAQLALNTLEASQVEVSGEPAKIVTPDGTTVYMGAAEYNVLYKGGDRYNTIQADNATTENGKNSAELGEDLFAGELEKSKDDKDNFGRPAVAWTYGGKEIGKYSAKAPVLTYTEGFDADELSDLKKDGYDFKAIDSDTLYVNGALNVGGLTTMNALANREYTGTAIELYAEDNTDSKAITRVVVIQGYLAQITDMDDESVTLDVYNPWLSDGKDDAVSFTVEDNTRSDDDWFDRLTSWYDTDEYLVLYLEGANVDDDMDILGVSNVDKVSGKVSTVKVGTIADGYNGTFTMDGTKYTLASAYNEVEIKAGDEYDFFLDENGYVIGAKAASDATDLTDYVFIKETGNAGFDRIAKALFMDGTSKTITVSELDDDEDFTWADTQGDANKFYTFKEKSNGEYELKVVKDSGSKIVTQGKQDNTYIDDVSRPIDGVDNSANSSTVFIAKDKVYTGVKNAPEVGSSTDKTHTAYYLLDESGRLMVVYTPTKGSASTDADELIYVLSDKKSEGLDDNDDTYYVYDVIMDGKKTTLTTKDDSLKPGVYEITAYEDDVYAELDPASTHDLVNKVDGITASDVDYKDGTLTLSSSKSFILADGVQIFTVDGTTVKTINASSIKNRVEDGFVNATLIEASSSNSDIVTIYLSK